MDGTPRTREPYLLPYQAAWVRDRSATKVCEKGRQEGYTWATAYESVKVASTRAADGGSDVWFMITSQQDAREFINECATWVKNLSPAMECAPGIDEYDWIEDDDPVAVQTYRISFPSGFSIHALPSRPARLRGKKGYAICDEAAHQDLDAWLKASGALMMWGGRRAIISTHNGTDSGFYRYIQRVRASIADGKPMASLHSVFLDSALEQGLYRRICRMSRPQRAWSREAEKQWVEELRTEYGEGADEELFGIVTGASNQLIGRAIVIAAQTLSPAECPIVEICGGERPRMWINGDLVAEASRPWPLPTESVADIDTPEERAALVRGWLDVHLAPLLRRVNGLGLDVHVGDDYGRTGDISCKIIGTNDAMNRRAVRMVIECDKVPATVQAQISDYCWPLLTRLRSGSGDGNGIGSTNAERAKDMTRGKMVVTMRLPDAAFTRVRSRIEAGEMALPRHGRELADDLTAIKRKGSSIETPRRRTDRGQQRHCDAAHALAHFEHSIDTDGRVVPIDPARRRPAKSFFPPAKSKFPRR